MANNNSKKSATCGTKSEQYVGLGSEKSNGAVESCASVNMERWAKELEIHAVKQGRFRPNWACCARLAEGMPDWLPARNFFLMADFLVGYNKGMADVITDCLLKFLWGEGRTVTGIMYVDFQLLAFYKELYDYATKHGKKLQSTLPF